MSQENYAQKPHIEMWILGQLFLNEELGYKPDGQAIRILSALVMTRDGRRFPFSGIHVVAQANRSLLKRRTVRRWQSMLRVPFFYVKDLAKALVVFD